MSVSSQINRIRANYTDCYTAVQEKGGTLPAVQNSTNLPTAIGTIKTGATIPQSSSARGSISQQIVRLMNEVDNAYNVCGQLGATMPIVRVSDNLAACIRSIPVPAPVGEYFNFYNPYSDSSIKVTIRFWGTWKSIALPTLEISTNKTTWTQLEPQAPLYSKYSYDVWVPALGRLYIRGNNVSLGDANNYTQFIMQDSRSVTVSGNIMSLLDKQRRSTTISQSYCFQKLFYQCYHCIVDGLELPATTLAPYCYKEMFYNTRSILTFPELPATTLAVGCYYNMFATAGLADSQIGGSPHPITLPATTLVSECYTGMFAGLSYGAGEGFSITVYFTSWLTGATNRWLYHSEGGNRGDFYCPSTLPQIRDTDHIHPLWIIHTF